MPNRMKTPGVPGVTDTIITRRMQISGFRMELMSILQVQAGTLGTCHLALKAVLMQGTLEVIYSTAADQEAALTYRKASFIQTKV